MSDDALVQLIEPRGKRRQMRGKPVFWTFKLRKHRETYASLRVIKFTTNLEDL